ncbi:hypothetical protein FZEAL_6892 [Fusarium zealandicum]|uniref:Uncharacterized protein n=1 Tax=Fusarium zealandicum TaxID=1053134 RepID=A0A8H4UGY1_9HYPO|nr:hypothetical protein FZEAL_6892 [Fusarium zealandicum]
MRSDSELRSIRTFVDGVTGENTHRGLAKDEQILRYRKRSIWILAFYLPLLVLPWGLTCILMYRPIHLHAYIDQSGSYTPRDIANLENFQTAVDVLTRIGAIVGIPIVSALLAHGAVVYTQRSRPGQKLSVLQMFTLADRQWLDVSFLWRVVFKSALPASSTYFCLAVGLVIITAIQPPLQSLLVPGESMVILTCKGHPWQRRKYDVPEACRVADGNTRVVAFDAEPTALASVSQDLVIRKATEKMMTVGRKDMPAYLWPSGLFNTSIDLPYDQQRFEWYLDNEAERHFFVSSVPAGTSTGVYRQHAVRMDSEITCEEAEDFPETCEGDHPFETSFSDSLLKIDICVKGSSTKTPWTTSRDKQEHSETLWLKMDSWVESYYYSSYSNFSLRCESTSRRGWFELPNHKNNSATGQMLDKWPSKEELANSFNDYVGEYSFKHADSEPKSDDTTDDSGVEPWKDGIIPTPGPLTTAAMAMFGNESFFDVAKAADNESSYQTAYQICQQHRLPFLNFFNARGDYTRKFWSFCNRPDLVGNEMPETLDLLRAYFEILSDASTTRDILQVGTYIANEALLTTAADRSDPIWRGGKGDARLIWSSPGHTIVKPKQNMAGMILISVLIGLQALTLCLLVAYIYSVPTWTSDLDADALAQIGAELRDWGQPRPELKHISGLVGVVETRGHETASVRALSMQDGEQPAASTAVRLGLGGEGVISSSKKMKHRESAVTQTTTNA